MSWLSAALKRNKKHAGSIVSAISAIPVVGSIASSAVSMAFNATGGKASNPPVTVHTSTVYKHQSGFRFNG